MADGRREGVPGLPRDPAPGRARGRRGFILAVLVAAAVVAAVAGVRAYVFPRELAPVTLSPREERTLAEKLDRVTPGAGERASSRVPGPPEPEPYSEEGADREVRLTEREINALLARNTDLARTVALHFSEDLLSATLLLPLAQDVPLLGGRTIKVTAGLELAYAEGRPRVVLRGVSVMGVPVPNAWLGGIKNVDLAGDLEAAGGFWAAFSAGVEDLRVEEGLLRVRLRE
ncbi:MAG: hypothetical protein SCH98_04745 [Deferrisomatales bacterium]|nr:hypothetical protein [Deferrisomatales bacterium]